MHVAAVEILLSEQTWRAIKVALPEGPGSRIDKSVGFRLRVVELNYKDRRRAVLSDRPEHSGYFENASSTVAGDLARRLQTHDGAVGSDARMLHFVDCGERRIGN